MNIRTEQYFHKYFTQHHKGVRKTSVYTNVPCWVVDKPINIFSQQEREYMQIHPLTATSCVVFPPLYGVVASETDINTAIEQVKLGHTKSMHTGNRVERAQYMHTSLTSIQRFIKLKSLEHPDEGIAITYQRFFTNKECEEVLYLASLTDKPNYLIHRSPDYATRIGWVLIEICNFWEGWLNDIDPNISYYFNKDTNQLILAAPSAVSSQSHKRQELKAYERQKAYEPILIAALFRDDRNQYTDTATSYLRQLGYNTTVLTPELYDTIWEGAKTSIAEGTMTAAQYLESVMKRINESDF